MVAGGGIGYVLFNRLLSSQKDEILAKAEQQGENIKEKKILQAKERFIQMKEKHNAEIKERNSNLQSKEDKVRNEFNKLRHISGITPWFTEELLEYCKTFI